MSHCQHENIVAYFTSFVAQEELWMVMELCTVGSLLDVIKHRIKTSEDNCRHGVFDEPFIATTLRDVLNGLEYLHSNGQLHRDIKAGNILMKEDGSIRIADFGVAARLAIAHAVDREVGRHTFVGTPCWMAPEVMEQPVEGYNYKADIWSVGITAIELATGAAPYHKHPPMKVLLMTLENDPPTLDTNATERDQYRQYGKTFRKMIALCLQKDPKERPSAKALSKHDFFKKSKDKSYLAKIVLSQGPIIRHQKVKRMPGQSGRLVRLETGDWEWEDDEVPENAEGEVKEAETPVSTPQQPAPLCKNSGKSLNLVLRLRNEKNELNDINFDFQCGTDSALAVAAELVEAGLVDGRDRVVVAANIDKIVESPDPGSCIVFQLSSASLLISGGGGSDSPTSSSAAPSQQLPDEKLLIGFAQLTLVDVTEVAPASSDTGASN